MAAAALAPADSAALVAEHLSRSFGPVRAVVDASISLEAGCVTALVGPNGSGKTTLLLMLTGLLAPDAGRVEVRGLDVATSGAAARRLIGWMPDVFGTWETLTCREVLETFAAAYRLPPAVAKERATTLLATVHLVDLADAPSRVLSRGQKQRLGLARALVHSPAVVLLDEPAAGLDPRSRIELRGIVRDLAEAGVAVLVSSHELAELEEMVDAAVFLQRGVSSFAPPTAALQPWRVHVLDGAAFLAWSAAVGLGVTQEAGGAGAASAVDPAASAGPAGPTHPTGPAGPATFLVSLTGELQAAQLVRDAVTAGVALTRFGPAYGRLEQAYLAMDTDRR